MEWPSLERNSALGSDLLIFMGRAGRFLKKKIPGSDVSEINIQDLINYSVCFVLYANKKTVSCIVDEKIPGPETSLPPFPKKSKDHSLQLDLF